MFEIHLEGASAPRRDYQLIVTCAKARVPHVERILRRDLRGGGLALKGLSARDGEAGDTELEFALEGRFIFDSWLALLVHHLGCARGVRGVGLRMAARG